MFMEEWELAADEGNVHRRKKWGGVPGGWRWKVRGRWLFRQIGKVMREGKGWVVRIGRWRGSC
jgi:hypothetical protein